MCKEDWLTDSEFSCVCDVGERYNDIIEDVPEVGDSVDKDEMGEVMLSSGCPDSGCPDSCVSACPVSRVSTCPDMLFVCVCPSSRLDVSIELLCVCLYISAIFGALSVSASEW
jgi:hypothetical protein